jgi:hypothetical protein
MSALNGEINLISVLLLRDWWGGINISNYSDSDLIKHFQGDIFAAMSAAEHIVGLARDYLYESGRSIIIRDGTSFNIQIYRPIHDAVFDDSFYFILAARCHNEQQGKWFNFEAVMVNGVWEVHDVTRH